MARPRQQTKKDVVIAFRVDGETDEKIREMEKATGLSRGLIVRALVKEALRRAEAQDRPDLAGPFFIA